MVVQTLKVCSSVLFFEDFVILNRFDDFILNSVFYDTMSQHDVNTSQDLREGIQTTSHNTRIRESP